MALSARDASAIASGVGIQVFDRGRQRIFEEKVLGAQWIDWAYLHPLGRALTGSHLFQRALSNFVGHYQSHPLSKNGIASFIRDYQIQMKDFVEPVEGYASFNDFFIRPLQAGARIFSADLSTFGASAEGRLSVWPLPTTQAILSVKGQKLSIETLLDDGPTNAARFVGGHAWVFRLCPVDYHRFHFPDSGISGPVRAIPGGLQSVNPQAIAAFPDVFVKNERHVCYFKSDHFKTIAMLEVGAMCVGKIHQTHPEGASFRRGDEKGYFEFGGSTTILLTLPNAVIPDPDLLARSLEGVESYVRLGETIGHAPA